MCNSSAPTHTEPLFLLTCHPSLAHPGPRTTISCTAMAAHLRILDRGRVFGSVLSTIVSGECSCVGLPPETRPCPQTWTKLRSFPTAITLLERGISFQIWDLVGAGFPALELPVIQTYGPSPAKARFWPRAICCAWVTPPSQELMAFR